MKTELVCCLLLMATINAVADWKELPPLPSPNGGFACGMVGNKILVVGGTNWKDGRKEWLDEISVFDPAIQKWTQHGRLPHPLAYAVAAEWKGDFIIAGGTDGNQPYKEVWRINPTLELKRISQLKDDAVVAVGGIIGDTLFVLGGCEDPSKLTGFHNRGARLDLSRGTISVLKPPGDIAFGLAAGIGLGHEWFTFGGASHAPGAELANVSAAWGFDPGKDTWRRLQPYPIAVRGAAAVKLDANRILVAGGYGGRSDDFTAATFIYDRHLDTYTQTTDLPIPALVGLVRAGDVVYCLGGEDKGGHRTAASFSIHVSELLKAAKTRAKQA